jgi:ABC-type bacteriocin/lantibiotic exporter with double-glycine peptidase domain
MTVGVTPRDLRARGLADLAAVDQAWAELGRAAAEFPTAPPDSALSAIADRLGITVPSGVSLPDGLRAAGVFWMEVRLTDHWYHQAATPLVAFDRDGQAVALFPSGRGYRGADGHRLSAAQAASFGPVGWQLYPPLGDAARSARGLIRYAATGARADIVILLVAGLLAAVAGGLLPFATGWLITRLAGGGQASGIIVSTAVLLGGLVIGNGLLLLTRNAATVRAQARLQSRLEPAVWAYMLDRDVAYLAGLGTGDLVQRANSVSEMRRALSDSAASAVLGSAFGLASLGILVAVDPVIGGLVLLSTVIVLGTASWAAVRQQRHELVNREEFGRVYAFLQSCLLAIEKIQVAGREERVFAGWAGRYVRQRATDAASLRWRAVVTGLGMGLQPLLLAVLGVTVVLLRPDVPLSTFVAANIAAGQFAASAGLLQSAVVSTFSLLSAYRRLRPILDAPPEVADGVIDPGRLHGAVDLVDVSYAYPGQGQPVLSRVNLRAEPGEFVAIVGPSGAGKTTVIRLLLGLVRATSGSVRFDGRDVGELDLRAVRRQLGVVLQQTRAIRGSIVDNVVAGAEEVPEPEVWRALALAGLADDVHQLPMGLNTMVSEDNASFSGGQIQRLMLARALVKRPPVLILDEATSALDNVTQRAVADRVAALSVTRIVVAHRLSTIRAADRIYVVDHGTVAASGTFTELLHSSPLFAQLIARQEVA